MDIDALTVCAGPVYAGYLKRSLPVWMDTLDSLTVVTRPDDGDTQEACDPYPRIRVVLTNVFKEYGASFNKGAALCQGYAAMDPVDGVLHFDSDILPDACWRKLAEARFQSGTIAGARRCEENGRPITDLGPWPYGYFQLWHSADPAVQFWPLFEPWHPSAGGYDLEFLEKWHKSSWKDLGFRVTHFGEVRKNWFGVGLPEEEQKESFKKMDEVHRVGLRATRIMARNPTKRLKVPPFKLKVIFSSKDMDWARSMMRACLTDNPFLVSASVGTKKPGHAFIKHDSGETPETMREKIACLL